jgi:hypothetical protein
VIELPEPDGTLSPYEPNQTPGDFPAGGSPPRARTLWSAAHVVADPAAPNAPYTPAVLDWDATLAFRRHLWSHGVGVAEAMDTSQRGLGVDWPLSAELIRRSAAEAAAVGGRLSAAVWTDQLSTDAPTLADVIAAYEEQLAVVEAAGARAIILASRALAAVARGPEDYAEVYGRLLKQAAEPVILHWVGPQFDPGLAGYWGDADLDVAMESFLAVVAEHAAKIDGVKVLPLELPREIELRRRLPDGVRCYTGDDFSYPTLMGGDGERHSHALLGVLDPLAPIAAAAVRRLDAGDPAGFRTLLDPTVALSAHLFEGQGMDVRFYKTGFTFLAWLAGHQERFTMVWGEQTGRSVPHLATAYRLADGLGLFPDPALAERRVREFLAAAGVTR